MSDVRRHQIATAVRRNRQVRRRRRLFIDEVMMHSSGGRTLHPIVDVARRSPSIRRELKARPSGSIARYLGKTIATRHDETAASSMPLSASMREAAAAEADLPVGNVADRLLMSRQRRDTADLVTTALRSRLAGGYGHVHNVSETKSVGRCHLDGS